MVKAFEKVNEKASKISEIEVKCMRYTSVFVFPDQSPEVGGKCILFPALFLCGHENSVCGVMKILSVWSCIFSEACKARGNNNFLVCSMARIFYLFQAIRRAVNVLNVSTCI